jgi:hypothetical protein
MRRDDGEMTGELAGRRGPAAAALTFLVTVALSLAALKYLSHPYLWVSGAWVTAFLAGMRITRRTVVHVLLWNLAVAAFVLGAAEAWATVQLSRKQHDLARYPPGFIIKDDDLGRAPRKGTSARVTRSHGASIVYDVVYTIDLYGLRRSPPDRGRDVRDCVLFFGNSYTFGEGLQDDETMPYRVAELGRGSVEVYNFGFGGMAPIRCSQSWRGVESHRLSTASRLMSFMRPSPMT